MPSTSRRQSPRGRTYVDSIVVTIVVSCANGSSHNSLSHHFIYFYPLQRCASSSGAAVPTLTVRNNCARRLSTTTTDRYICAARLLFHTTPITRYKKNCPTLSRWLLHNGRRRSNETPVVSGRARAPTRLLAKSEARRPASTARSRRQTLHHVVCIALASTGCSATPGPRGSKPSG